MSAILLHFWTLLANIKLFRPILITFSIYLQRFLCNCALNLGKTSLIIIVCSDNCNSRKNQKMVVDDSCISKKHRKWLTMFFYKHWIKHRKKLIWLFHPSPRSRHAHFGDFFVTNYKWKLWLILMLLDSDKIKYILDNKRIKWKWCFYSYSFLFITVQRLELKTKRYEMKVLNVKGHLKFE